MVEKEGGRRDRAAVGGGSNGMRIQRWMKKEDVDSGQQLWNEGGGRVQEERRGKNERENGVKR